MNVPNGVRTSLSSNVGIGVSQVLNATLRATDTVTSTNLPLGTYTLKWQMVHEGVAWIPVEKAYSVEVKASCGGGIGELNLCKIKPWICKGYMVKPRIPKRPEPDPRWKEYLDEIQVLKNKYPNASAAERLQLDRRANELDGLLQQKGFNQKSLQ